MLKRLLGFTATLLLASGVIFVVMEVLPGDPAQIILGTQAQEDTLAALRAKLGLDRPFLERYLSWVGGMITGNFKLSYTYDVPTIQLISERVRVSLPLALMTILLTVVLAIPAGLYSAAKHQQWLDSVISIGAQIGLAIPNFWFATLLILIFAVTLQWVPAGGFAGWDASFGPAIKSLLLPAFALALSQTAILTRVTRAATLEVLSEEYTRTAYAKGASSNRVLWRHTLRNALIPVMTIIGLQFSFLLAGTIIIENVFYLPGLGRLLFQSIFQRDLIVVQDLVMLLVASVLCVNLVVDMFALYIDPRLRRPHDEYV